MKIVRLKAKSYGISDNAIDILITQELKPQAPDSLIKQQKNTIKTSYVVEQNIANDQQANNDSYQETAPVITSSKNNGTSNQFGSIGKWTVIILVLFGIGYCMKHINTEENTGSSSESSYSKSETEHESESKDHYEGTICTYCRMGRYVNGYCNHCSTVSPSKEVEVKDKYSRSCPFCNGTGRRGDSYCTSCNGTGKLSKFQ